MCLYMYVLTDLGMRDEESKKVQGRGCRLTHCYIVGNPLRIELTVVVSLV